MRHGRGDAIALAVALPAILTGCAMGAKLEKFPLAHGPRGATAVVSTSTEVVSGELLEVRPDAMLLLTHSRRQGRTDQAERRLVLVGYSVPREARFAELHETLSRGFAPDAAQRERLRLVSRFPQGVSADLLKLLLDDCGQDGPETLRP
jgi:hypothetical protein